MRRLGRLSLTMIACLTVGAALQAQQGPPAGEAETPTAPVTLDGVTLFHVRGVSSLPADQRAQRIEERLRAVAADDTIAPETLRMVESEDAIRIFAGDTLIMGVVDPDASLELVRRADLASSHLERLRQAISDYRVARSGEALRRGAIDTVLGTLLLAAVIFAVNRVWRWVDGSVSRRLGRHIHSVQIQSLEVRGHDDFAGAFAAAIHARTEALIVVSSRLMTVNRARILDLAARDRMLLVSGWGPWAAQGGLLSYGPDLDAVIRRSATYVDRILKGARPADIPVEQPTKFELVINLRTAAAVGLTIPPALLARADQLIE